MKRDYEMNEINEKYRVFVYFVHFVLFRNLAFSSLKKIDDSQYNEVARNASIAFKKKPF